MEVGFNYGFDEDSVIRLQKDLNHLLTNLDSQNVKKLYTEYCDISSKKGETVIDGPLIDMFDFNALTSMASTTLRLRMGYDASTSDFVFKLFNASGIETISLDASGNAVFSGNVNSSADIHVGNNLYLGITDSPEYKGIYFNTTTPTTDPFSIDVTGLLWDKVNDSFNLLSTGALIAVASSNLEFIAGESLTIGKNTTALGWTNYFHISSTRILLMADNNSPIDIGSPAYFTAGYFSTVSGLYEHTINCTSDGVFVDSNVSSNLVATKGWVMPKVIRRFSSTTKVSSTVPTNDSVLSLTLDANSYYSVECNIGYWSTAAAQKFITTWSTDNITAWVNKEVYGLSTDSTGVRGTYQALRTNLGDTVRYGCPTQGGGTAALIEKGIVLTSSNGATFSFRWAQKVSSTTPMSISGNSYLMATKVQI